MIDSPELNDFPINMDLSEIARVDNFLFPDPFKDIRNSGYPYKDHEATCFKCGKKYIAMCYFKNIAAYICPECSNKELDTKNYKEMAESFEKIFPEGVPPRIARTLNDLFDSFKDRPEELKDEIEQLVNFLNEKYPWDEYATFPYVYHKLENES